MNINVLIDRLCNIHSLISIFFVLFMILIIDFKKRKTEKNIGMLSLISIIAGIAHFFYYVFPNVYLVPEYFVYIYIMVGLIFLVAVFRYKNIVFYILCPIVTLCSLFCAYKTVSLTGDLNIHNFGYSSYREGFNNMIDTMKQEYTMSEWKEIDYEELRSKYIPLIEKAEYAKDKDAYYDVIYKFVSEFKDANVKVKCRDCHQYLESRANNKYYGFRTILLDDGKLVAIFVNEKSNAYQLGLRDGNVITKKNGKDVNDLLEKEYFFKEKSIAVKDTEKLYASTMLFLEGEESIEVTFIDDNGEEKNIKLSAVGKDNNIVLDKLLYKYDTENLFTRMLNDEVGYINITNQDTSKLQDILGYLKGENKKAKEIFINKLNDLKNQGMKKLVIDLRGNKGGSIINASSFAAPFMKDSFVYGGSRGKLLGDYDTYKVIGTGEYADYPVIVLVDNDSVDNLAYILKSNKNVKVVGYMASSNSIQGAGGEIYLKDKIAVLYPTLKRENTEGEILIDTIADGKARVSLDVKIPITKENVLEIMNYDGDYVLDYAVKLFDQEDVVEETKEVKEQG